MSTVLITGASSGLGRELAMLYAQEGHHLVLVARSKDKLEQIKNEIEACSLSSVSIMASDLSRSEAPAEVCARLEELGIEVDVLINNAGVGVYGAFLTADLGAIRTMYQVNLMAPLAFMRFILPGMAERNKGQVVNVASLGAFFPGPWMAAYFGAKADLYSLTRAVERELKGSSVRLSLACPGPFKSGFQRTAFGQKRDQMKEDRLPSAQETARQIYEGIARQERLIIPGFKNKLTYWCSRALPKSWVIEAVHRSQCQLSCATLTARAEHTENFPASF